MTYQEKLQKLREVMKAQGFDAFLVPRTDEYLGEYVPECAERLAWLTGFTGSAGLAVILADKAMVMSDGRYTIQLAAEVDEDLYERVNSQETKPDEWLVENVGKSLVIGYDPKLHTPAQIIAKEEAGLILKPVEMNLVDVVWEGRPQSPISKVSLFPEKFSGMSASDKMKVIQTDLKDNKADAVILTMSDSIAWLLNIRGNDIPYIPVCLSYLILPVEGKAQWFVHEDKITKDVREKLEGFVEFKAEGVLVEALSDLKGAVWLDPKRSSIWFRKALEREGVDVLEKDDPCIVPRACKNNVEQEAMRQAHICDGVAMVKFLKWFDENSMRGELSELTVEQQLENFRAQASEFKEPSFNTISGFGSNGAIVHYRADEKSNKVIENGNLLLLDSGAQYEDGTTDITRTIAVGDVPQEMKICNTLVLKGHIALASAQFTAETKGKELDQLARQYLHEKGLNYAHGTGHGVGCYLSVHEEAAMGISPRSEEPLKAGMVISNEPGFYKEGEYGIRIENLVLVKEEDSSGLYFETITLAPIDKNLIVKDMLHENEIAWVNDYHAQVFETLSPLLNEDHHNWLKEVTSEL